MNAVTEFTIFIFFLLIIIWWVTHSSTDDSDHPTEKKKKSGLIIFTDYGTGVQYVGTPLGGITPRLNADGSIRTINKVQE